jgi:hypothetical protein
MISDPLVFAIFSYGCGNVGLIVSSPDTQRSRCLDGISCGIALEPRRWLDIGVLKLGKASAKGARIHSCLLGCFEHNNELIAASTMYVAMSIFGA